MKNLKFIFPLLFILFSCSSISPEDSEIIDDFIIGNWKYSTYQEDYKSESVVDNEVMLKIFKDNDQLKFKWDHIKSFEGSFSYYVKDDNLFFEMIPNTEGVDISKNQEFIGELDFDGKFNGDNYGFSKSSFEEKINFMKKQLEFRKNSYEVLKSSEFRWNDTGWYGPLVNQYSKRKQNQNFSIKYSYSWVPSSFYKSNGGVLSISGFYTPYGGGFNSKLNYVIPGLGKNKKDLKTQDDFTTSEMELFINILSSENSVYDTNYIGWSNLKFDSSNELKEYDLKSIKGKNEVESIKVTKKGNKSLEIKKLEFKKNHRRRSSIKDYFGVYVQINNEGDHSWLGLKSVDFENKRIILGDNDKRFYMTLGL